MIILCCMIAAHFVTANHYIEVIFVDSIMIANTILSKRRQKGMTQDDLADHFGVTKASVSKWEKGLSYPDITLLPLLAAFFDISIDELIGYTPQLSKGEIKSLYLKFTSDFLKKPYKDVMAEIQQAIKKYYSCYPFLLQMAILLMNHHLLAEEGEARNNVLEDALALCCRIKTESDDMVLRQEVNSFEAVLNLVLNRPTEVIDLLHDSTLRPISHDELVLATAYKLRGDATAAKQALQITNYQYVLHLVESVVRLLPLYTSESERFEEILRRGLAVADVFQLDALHPYTYCQLTMTAAICLVELGDKEWALSLLEKCVDACAHPDFPVAPRGDAYFDLLEDWMNDNDLGNNMPGDPVLLRIAYLEQLKTPALAPLFEMPEYKRILAKAKGMQ